MRYRKADISQEQAKLIEAWTTAFLAEIEQGPQYVRNVNHEKYTVVFGRTTHSRNEDENESKSCQVRTSSIPELRSPFQGVAPMRSLRSSYQASDRSETSSSISTSMAVDKPLNLSTQEAKIKGRQIMNAKQDIVKAKKIRKRQMTYAREVKNTRKNRVAMEINTINRIVVQGFRKLIDCERCALFLMDHTTNELYFRPIDHPTDIRFSASAGVAGWVATNMKLLNIRGAYQDPRFNPDIDRQTGFRTRNIICAPVLSSNGELYGVIQMVNKKHEDLKTIQHRAKEKKTDSEYHGYESCYESFNVKDEELIRKCCEHISVSLESIFSPNDKNDDSNCAGQDTAGADTKEARKPKSGRRRSSIGSLFQFVSNKERGKVETEKQSNGAFGKDASISEAMTKFQFRSGSIGKPQISSGGQLEDDPNRLIAVSKRKRILDYQQKISTVNARSVKGSQSY